MTHIRKRIVIGAIAIGLAGAAAKIALASGRPYQAVCETWSCRWAGAQRLDLYEAYLDARSHWTGTGHHVRIEGLPRDRPLITSDGLSSHEMGGE
jgi:hypothetical protein